jgi:hypothetical protein
MDWPRARIFDIQELKPTSPCAAVTPPRVDTCWTPDHPCLSGSSCKPSCLFLGPPQVMAKTPQALVISNVAHFEPQGRRMSPPLDEASSCRPIAPYCTFEKSAGFVTNCRAEFALCSGFSNESHDHPTRCYIIDDLPTRTFSYPLLRGLDMPFKCSKHFEY